MTRSNLIQGVELSDQAFIIFNFISLISYIDARISELEQRLQNLFEAVSGQPGISSKVQTLESEVSDIKVHQVISYKNILIIVIDIERRSIKMPNY